MVPAQKRVLCVDNNASSNLAVYLLERVGYEVTTASSLADASKLAQLERFDLQLINHRLIDGLEIDSCARLNKFAPRTPILFYSTVAYPYEQMQPIHCRQHHHAMAPVYVYDVVGHASRLLQKKIGTSKYQRSQGTAFNDSPILEEDVLDKRTHRLFTGLINESEPISRNGTRARDVG